MIIARCIALFSLVSLMGNVFAVEYHVAQNGSDANDGRTQKDPFATIQKGVDALDPGDTLTIGPGEYFEGVRRDKLGGRETETVIRAEIPGSVLIRGDVSISGFTSIPGDQFTYVTDVDFPEKIQMVSELDTMRVLSGVPKRSELKFTPGTFYHNVESGKLYVATSDGHPASEHRYSACVIPKHGLYLSNPVRVVIKGLTATGFNAGKEGDMRDYALRGTWGIFLAKAKDCAVRHCAAFLNGQGIGVSSYETGGGNVIERCEAWANATQYGVGDRGGLTLHNAKGDVIRDSISYLNGGFGVNIRGGAKNSMGAEDRSELRGNIAWGNGLADLKIKSGKRSANQATVHCYGVLASTDFNPEHCLLGSRGIDLYHDYGSRDNVYLNEEKNLVMGDEFADSDNFDFRLQATSRFRNSAPDGGDRGPFPYKPNVFFVTPTGDDGKDGLSGKNAWRTLAAAAGRLKAGDTLYLEGGDFNDDVEIEVKGTTCKPISIMGRGTDAPVLSGNLTINGGGHVSLGRLCLTGEVALNGAKTVAFEQCRFNGPGLKADKTSGLRLEHCLFTGFPRTALELRDCAGIDLRGNLFDNQKGPAVAVDDLNDVVYSDYNGYAVADSFWVAGGKAVSKQSLNGRFESHSRIVPARFAVDGGTPKVANPEVVEVGDLAGRPFGPFRHEKADLNPRLTSKPLVHSVSATTANVEWRTSSPARCEIAWGETAKCENKMIFDVNHFGTYSLTGLKPGATYHFQIRSLSKPTTPLEALGFGMRENASKRLVPDAPISFTTLAENAKPIVYHVAPDGDDKNDGKSRKTAFRTIQRAADQVNVGDTVLVTGGTYAERVRIRATGEGDASITFKSTPGEKVTLTGENKQLNQNFVVAGKSHLRFDGFHFKDSNRMPLGGWLPGMCGEFNLNDCRNIEITRCFSDGRGGYSARFVTAWKIDGLLIKNCVVMNKMSAAMQFWRCPNVRLENNVFARQMIGTFVLNNTVDQPIIIKDNIFTDMLLVKAKGNDAFGEVEEAGAMKLDNNCFALRCFAPKDRIIFCDVDHAIHKVTDHYTMPTFDETFGNTHTLFVEPAFAKVVELEKKDGKRPTFPSERLLNSKLDIDFDSFFATHPEVVKRGIGLQPEAFEEFGFFVDEGKTIDAKD